MKEELIALGFNDPIKVNILGMELDEWQYKSCVAHVGEGEGWATVGDIRSRQEGRGHATSLLLVMQSHYENKGKRFGGSVALNERMRRIYRRCGVKEYRGIE